MSLFDALALFVIMATLAALPSASVLLVVSQTVRHGTRHGYWAVAITDNWCFLLTLDWLAARSGRS